MYITSVTIVFLCLSEALVSEGGVTSRFKRDTDRSHVEAIYSRYKSLSRGEATYYGKYPGNGACSLDPLSPLANQPGWIRVAAGQDDFQNSLGCGMCVEIKGSGEGKGNDPVNGTLKGVVHDLCVGCKQGDLDLYIDGDGRWSITMQAIDCPTLTGSDGNIMMRFTGSNPWYIKLQARNAKVPVAGIEVLKSNKYSCLKRVRDNYFVGDGLGKVDFPVQVRLTAINGEQRETIIPTLKNDEDITTDIQFTGHQTGGGPSTLLCLGQGNKPPYPSGGLDPSGSGTSPSQPSNAAPPAPNLTRPPGKTTYSDEVRTESGINEIMTGPQMDERKVNEKKPLDILEQHPQKGTHVQLSTHSRSDRNITEMAKEQLVYNSKDKHTPENLSKSGQALNSSGKANVASNVRVVFGGMKKNGTTQDNLSRENPSHPSESMVHLTIHADRSIGASSSSSKSPDEMYKSKPSFEIIVNSDGVNANTNGKNDADKVQVQSSQNGSGETGSKQGPISEEHNPKPNSEPMIRKNTDQVRNEKFVVREDSPLVSKVDDNKGQTREDELQKNGGHAQAKENSQGELAPQEKAQNGHEEGSGGSKENVIHTGLMPPPSSNKLRPSNGTDATSINRTKPFADGTSKTEIKPSNDDRKANQTSSQMINQPNVIKVQSTGSEAQTQEPLQRTQDQSTSTKETLAPLATLTKALIHAEKSLGDVHPSGTIFHHPLEALTAYDNRQHQRLSINEKKKEESDKMEIEDKKNDDQKVGEISGKVEEKLTSGNNTRTDDHEQQKRPMFDTLVRDEERKQNDIKEGEISGSKKVGDKLRNNNATAQRQGQEQQKRPILDTIVHTDTHTNDTTHISESGRHEGKLEDKNTTTQKQPLLDIVVHGGKDGTTELRIRNHNNEIARHNDGGGKTDGRAPLVGITIKQKDSPDHHIFLNKRQKLMKLKHRQQHHRH